MANAGRVTAAVFVAAMLSLVAVARIAAQQPDLTNLDTANPAAQGRGRGAAKTPKEAAPIDLTGYWVSIVSEDWRFRMVTPPKGDFPDVPLNPEGVKLGNAWDPAKDEAAADKCKAYGAPNIMRVPARFHVTWADDRTLKMEVDAGNQTRLFHFGALPAAPGPPQRQGYSTARWEGRTLYAATNNLLPGYLQSNGAPFSAKATMTESLDVIKEPGGEIWLIISTAVTDPTYLMRSMVRSTHLRKQADGAGWDPSPCVVR
jgi:hypothetical protein